MGAGVGESRLDPDAVLRARQLIGDRQVRCVGGEFVVDGDVELRVRVSPGVPSEDTVPEM